VYQHIKPNRTLYSTSQIQDPGVP